MYKGTIKASLIILFICFGAEAASYSLQLESLVYNFLLSGTYQLNYSYGKQNGYPQHLMRVRAVAVNAVVGVLRIPKHYIILTL